MHKKLFLEVYFQTQDLHGIERKKIKDRKLVSRVMLFSRFE